jgi:hypothetical protein
MEVREEHQDNPRGTRDVLTSQTVTATLRALLQSLGLATRRRLPNAGTVEEEL